MLFSIELNSLEFLSNVSSDHHDSNLCRGGRYNTLPAPKLASVCFYKTVEYNWLLALDLILQFNTNWSIEIYCIQNALRLKTAKIQTSHFKLLNRSHFYLNSIYTYWSFIISSLVLIRLKIRLKTSWFWLSNMSFE